MADEQKTILVIDDTPANIDVVKNILLHQYYVQAVTSGKRALELVERRNSPGPLTGV